MADHVRVFAHIRDERTRQEARFPEQHLPDGTGPDVAFGFFGYMRDHEADARAEVDAAAKSGGLTWRHVLTEEFFEVLAEADPRALRVELIQVAAVAVRWVEDIDRRERMGA